MLLIYPSRLVDENARRWLNDPCLSLRHALPTIFERGLPCWFHPISQIEGALAGGRLGAKTAAHPSRKSNRVALARNHSDRPREKNELNRRVESPNRTFVTKSRMGLPS